jgi:clan AA aspartic protease (TIGR02281 family)
MTARLSIVEARRGRAALGRQILGTALGVVIVAGMLVAKPDNGFGVPAGPPPQISGSNNALILPASSHGRCTADLWIGGTRLRGAIADSGADGWITIGRNQAKQAGIDTSQLRFNNTYDSANGRGHFAVTHLRSARIGNFELIGIPAAVTDADQSEAIIGIEILRDLHFRVRGNHCELSSEERA